MAEEKYYTADEVGEKLNVTPKTIRDWIKSGKLHAFRFGNVYRISEKDINDFIEKSRIQ